MIINVTIANIENSFPTRTLWFYWAESTDPYKDRHYDYVYFSIFGTITEKRVVKLLQKFFNKYFTGHEFAGKTFTIEVKQ